MAEAAHPTGWAWHRATGASWIQDIARGDYHLDLRLSIVDCRSFLTGDARSWKARIKPHCRAGSAAPSASASARAAALTVAGAPAEPLRTPRVAAAGRRALTKRSHPRRARGIPCRRGARRRAQAPPLGVSGCGAGGAVSPSARAAVTSSARVQGRSASPAATAGVVPSVLWTPLSCRLPGGGSCRLGRTRLVEWQRCACVICARRQPFVYDESLEGYMGVRFVSLAALTSVTLSGCILSEDTDPVMVIDTEVEAADLYPTEGEATDLYVRGCQIDQSDGRGGWVPVTNPDGSRVQGTFVSGVGSGCGSTLTDATGCQVGNRTYCSGTSYKILLCSIIKVPPKPPKPKPVFPCELFRSGCN